MLSVHVEGIGSLKHQQLQLCYSVSKRCCLVRPRKYKAAAWLSCVDCQTCYTGNTRARTCLPQTCGSLPVRGCGCGCLKPELPCALNRKVYTPSYTDGLRKYVCAQMRWENERQNGARNKGKGGTLLGWCMSKALAAYLSLPLLPLSRLLANQNRATVSSRTCCSLAVRARYCASAHCAHAYALTGSECWPAA